MRRPPPQPPRRCDRWRFACAGAGAVAGSPSFTSMPFSVAVPRYQPPGTDCVPQSFWPRSHVARGPVDGVGIEHLSKRGIAVRSAGDRVLHVVTRAESVGRTRSSRRGGSLLEGLREEACLGDEDSQGRGAVTLTESLDRDRVRQAGARDRRGRRSFRGRGGRKQQQCGERRHEQHWTSHESLLGRFEAATPTGRSGFRRQPC